MSKTSRFATTPFITPSLYVKDSISVLPQRRNRRESYFGAVPVRGISVRANSGDNKVLSLAAEDPDLDSALYIVSTPIGNLGDITLRAIRTLRSVSWIYAEDTRRTKQLLNVFEIRTTLRSCHAHNEDQRIKQILEHLRNNEAVALVSDAGTPTVSDPGSKIINSVVEAHYRVVPIPGPSALLTSVVASGLTSNAFTFIGFLPSKRSERRRRLEDWVDLESALVVYISPSDLTSVLKDCVEVLGGTRRCCLGREMTKLHEAFHHSDLTSCFEEYAKRRESVKGELTLVIEGAPSSSQSMTSISVPDHVVSAILQHRLQLGDSMSQAARNVSTELGIKKRRAYSLGLKLKQKMTFDDCSANNHQRTLDFKAHDG